MKRLLNIAYNKREEEEASNFIKRVTNLVKEGLEHYVKFYCNLNPPPT